MSLNREKIINVLKGIFVHDDNNLIDAGYLDQLKVIDNTIDLDIRVSNPTLQFKNKLKKLIKEPILKLYPKTILNITFVVKKETSSSPLSKVKNIIAVASGKGGVGKSTVSSNLAVSLVKLGYKVGIIDADIYGPSLPLMFDVETEKPRKVEKNNQSLISPIENHGVKIMSIGFFSSSSDAIVWRGPMATKALKTIITQTDWGELDYLLIDLPPGTSDIHLSLVQTVPLTGALVVSTPQPVSLIDASKAINMFQLKDIKVPVLGLVENMSWYLIGENKHYIFGRDGGKSLSESSQVPLLIELPLNQTIREAGDVGRPVALQNTDLGGLFLSLATRLVEEIDLRNQKLPKTKKVEISHNRGCN